MKEEKTYEEKGKRNKSWKVLKMQEKWKDSCKKKLKQGTTSGM